jgi:hypothetical protein
MRCGIRDVQWTWSLGLKRESRVETATYMSLDGNFNSCPLYALPSWECLSYTRPWQVKLSRSTNAPLTGNGAASRPRH